MTRRVVATVALTAALTITPTVAAFAGSNRGGGHTPIVVCHNAVHNPHIIVVDDDSTKLHAHLDHRHQSQLMDLVEGYDGTADQIRAACVPKPSPTTPAPSPTSHPTPTETTPCPTVSQSSSPSPSGSPTTSSTPSSGTTTATNPPSTGTPTATATTSATSQPVPSTMTPTSPATSPERPVKSTAPTTGRRSSPSTTSAPPSGEQLANTGGDLSTPVVLAIVLLAVGGLVWLFVSVLGRRGEH